MSTSGKYGPLGLEQDDAYYYVLCLSVTKLFLVLFKYCIMIIKKVDMLYVVLNIIASKQATWLYYYFSCRPVMMTVL